MKLLSAAVVAVLTAGVSMTAAAAPAGYVPYKCDNGKKLNVVYEFDRKGNAVGASANAAGKQISLRVDKRRSDSEKARIGIHNDCYLASIDDTGTYQPRRDQTIEAQRMFTRQHVQYTSFGGETCAPIAQARTTCSDILREGKEYRLGYLNYDYHEDFINGWEKEGCMADVRKNIGYRIELSQFQISSKAQSGSLKWALKLSNQGWARPLNPRDIVVRFTSADGSSKDVALENTNLRTLDAGERAQWEGTLTLPGLSAGEYSVSLGAPDPDARLAGNTRFSLRFANADSGSVQWNLRTGFLDTGLKVQVP